MLTGNDIWEFETQKYIGLTSSRGQKDCFPFRTRIICEHDAISIIFLLIYLVHIGKGSLKWHGINLFSPFVYTSCNIFYFKKW